MYSRPVVHPTGRDWCCYQPRVAVDERKTIYTYACSDASVDENAFDQGAAQLQSEFDDLIGGVLATSAATAHRR